MSLGFLAPAVCVGFVALDLALRLVPLDSLAFRAWEAVTVRHSRLSPFGVNIHYHNDRAHGELASMANRPDLSEFHPETFTTDAFGFRNSPTESSAGPPGGILVGSSFSAGCGVNDEETLSVRLGQRLGRPVYNAAGLTPSLELIRSVARRLRVASGVVWYEYYEPNPLPVSEQTAQRWRTRLPDWTVLQLLNSWKTSRLKILAGRAYRLLENNAFLPRTTPSHLGVRLLENGHPMIFANPTDLPGPSAIGQAGAYWSWLADELHKDGLSLVVLLVPGKYTVYHSLLRDKPRLSPPGAE